MLQKHCKKHGYKIFVCISNVMNTFSMSLIHMQCCKCIQNIQMHCLNFGQFWSLLIIIGKRTKTPECEWCYIHYIHQSSFKQTVKITSEGSCVFFAPSYRVASSLRRPSPSSELNGFSPTAIYDKCCPWLDVWTQA